MTEQNDLHFRNAPIREAIIDLRVQLPEEIESADLAKFQDPHRIEYPKLLETGVNEFRFEIGERPSATAEVSSRGFRFFSPDGKQVAQARSDGFTFSRLAPYECWETFRDEARRLWDSYRELYRPIAITRLAVRYVNRLDLPAPAELNEYLLTYPEVAAGLPQTLTGLLMQLRIPQDDLRSQLILTQAMVPPVAPGMVSILLDIDLSRDCDIPESEGKVWDLFDTLRRRKNEVFLSCITSKTQELIN